MAASTIISVIGRADAAGSDVRYTSQLLLLNPVKQEHAPVLKLHRPRPEQYELVTFTKPSNMGSRPFGHISGKKKSTFENVSVLVCRDDIALI